MFLSSRAELHADISLDSHAGVSRPSSCSTTAGVTHAKFLGVGKGSKSELLSSKVTTSSTLSRDYYSHDCSRFPAQPSTAWGPVEPPRRPFSASSAAPMTTGDGRLTAGKSRAANSCRTAGKSWAAKIKRHMLVVTIDRLHGQPLRNVCEQVFDRAFADVAWKQPSSLAKSRRCFAEFAGAVEMQMNLAASEVGSRDNRVASLLEVFLAFVQGGKLHEVAKSSPVTALALLIAAICYDAMQWDTCFKLTVSYGVSLPKKEQQDSIEPGMDVVSRIMDASGLSSCLNASDWATCEETVARLLRGMKNVSHQRLSEQFAKHLRIPPAT